jgi:hypothetical protein
MTTHSAIRPKPNRRALGTGAAVVAAVGTVLAGVRLIGVTPTAIDIAPYCIEAHQCLQPGADPLTSYRADPLAAYQPAV